MLECWKGICFVSGSFGVGDKTFVWDAEPAINRTKSKVVVEDCKTGWRWVKQSNQNYQELVKEFEDCVRKVLTKGNTGVNTMSTADILINGHTTATNFNGIPLALRSFDSPDRSRGLQVPDLSDVQLDSMRVAALMHGLSDVVTEIQGEIGYRDLVLSI